MFTCPSCGRREARIQPIVPNPIRLVAGPALQETMDLFDRTVKNLLTMPPMPRKRRKA